MAMLARVNKVIYDRVYDWVDTQMTAFYDFLLKTRKCHKYSQMHDYSRKELRPFSKSKKVTLLEWVFGSHLH